MIYSNVNTTSSASWHCCSGLSLFEALGIGTGSICMFSQHVQLFLRTRKDFFATCMPLCLLACLHRRGASCQSFSHALWSIIFMEETPGIIITVDFVHQFGLSCLLHACMHALRYTSPLFAQACPVATNPASASLHQSVSCKIARVLQSCVAMKKLQLC